MNIGDVAKRTGLPAKTIRYYEEIGLIRPGRTANGYRRFADADIRKLTFVGRARALGFPVDACRALLTLWDGEARPDAEAERIVAEHLAEIDAKIDALQEMRGTLARLIGAAAEARSAPPTPETTSDPQA